MSVDIANLFLFIVSIATLFYSGGLLVRSLTVLGRYLRLSEYVLSFILVAFATSLPELFVGINSALRGVPVLSLGNIIGANVLNISLVLGISIVFSGGLNVERPIEKEDYFFVLGIVLIPIFMIIDGVIGRIDGGILIGIFFLYTFYLTQTSHKNNIVNGGDFDIATPAKTIRHFFLFIVGAGLLLGSSSFVVSYSIDVANYFMLPLFLVGILISVGTTLPEVVFSFKSASMRHNSMSLGNVFGSIVINIAVILGLVAVFNPIVVSNIYRTVLGLALTAVLMIVIQIIGFIKGRLEYWFGGVLIFTAIFFVIIEALLK